MFFTRGELLLDKYQCCFLHQNPKTHEVKKSNWFSSILKHLMLKNYEFDFFQQDLYRKLDICE